MATSVGDAQKQLESRPNDVEAQDVEAQDVEAQDVEAQDVEAQGVEAQVVEAQELEAQDLEAQDVEAQEAQELEAQELEAQELEAQGLEAQEAQELEAQELEAQELEAQELEAQELEAQELEAQELEAQELEAQELEAQELEAQNIKAQGVEDKETRRAILVSTEEVSGETVWSTEFECRLSGPASAPRGSGPVTVLCVTAQIGKLGVETVEVKPFGAESSQQRMDKFAITILGSSAVFPVCALVKPTLELDLKCASLQTIAQLAEMVSTGNIPPWPPPTAADDSFWACSQSPHRFDLGVVVRR